MNADMIQKYLKSQKTSEVRGEYNADDWQLEDDDEGSEESDYESSEADDGES